MLHHPAGGLGTRSLTVAQPRLRLPRCCFVIPQPQLGRSPTHAPAGRQAASCSLTPPSPSPHARQQQQHQQQQHQQRSADARPRPRSSALHASAQQDPSAAPAALTPAALDTVDTLDSGDDSTTRARRLPSQADTMSNPAADSAPDLFSKLAVAEKPEKQDSDLDYLTELLAMQFSDGPKALGFFGTRNMGVTHQKLVEVLAYAYVSTGNHIYTSGSTGTNAAVIKGALRAGKADLLTVILPQSLSKQPSESQALLAQVGDLIQMPQHDDLSLLEASRLCNRQIISRVQQVISFAFHDSRLILEAAAEAKGQRKIVTLFYLD